MDPKRRLRLCRYVYSLIEIMLIRNIDIISLSYSTVYIVISANLKSHL